MLTAELLLAFNEQTCISLASDILFPFGSDSDLREEIADELRARKEFNENLVLLAEHTNQQIKVPDQYTVSDIATAAQGAEIIRTREGRLTINELSAEVDVPSEIPHLPDRLVEGDPVARQPISLPVFDQELLLGVAEFPQPKMKIVDVIPHGTDPNSPARVVLQVDGDPQVDFRLVDE